MVPKTLALTFTLLASLASGAKWSYSGDTGPEFWDAVCAAGNSQSPIDLVDPEYADLGEFQFHHYKLDPWVIKVENNGYGAKISYQSKTNYTPSIAGAGLPGKFEFAQFHMHWGAKSDRGSEHIVEGKPYPMELHLVHFNKK